MSATPRKRDPQTAWTDAELTEQIRAAFAADAAARAKEDWLAWG